MNNMQIYDKYQAQLSNKYIVTQWTKSNKKITVAQKAQFQCKWSGFWVWHEIEWQISRVYYGISVIKQQNYICDLWTSPYFGCCCCYCRSFWKTALWFRFNSWKSWLLQLPNSCRTRNSLVFFLFKSFDRVHRILPLLYIDNDFFPHYRLLTYTG